MPSRVRDYDFARGILILLMVLFHIAAFAAAFPRAMDGVYVFHMPGFLLISGFLTHTDKPPRDFARHFLRLFVPYLIFGSLLPVGVTLFGRFLHSQNTAPLTSFADFCIRLLVRPDGPYWYLHTLFLALLAAYFFFWLAPRTPVVSRLFPTSAARFVGLSLTCFLLSRLGLLKWYDILYFLLGFFVSHLLRRPLNETLIPTLWAAVPAAVCFAFAPDRGTLTGVCISLCVLSWLFALCRTLPTYLTDGVVYLGRNTMSVLCFSPIFTIVSKQFSPAANAPSHVMVLFGLLSVAGVVAACLMAARLTDRLRLTRYLFCTPTLYSPFESSR